MILVPCAAQLVSRIFGGAEKLGLSHVDQSRLTRETQDFVVTPQYGQMYPVGIIMKTEECGFME